MSGKPEEIVNPPIIQSYEQDIASAAASGDEDRLALVYEDYYKERGRLADRLERRRSEVVASEPDSKDKK